MTTSHAKTVRLVTGDQTEILSESEALRRAADAGMDLVIINEQSDPPVAKIMDEGKYNYELEKRQKRQKRAQRQVQSKIKEIQLRPVTGDNDIAIKAKNIKEFLSKGNTVKVMVKFRGRENSHIEMGEEVIAKLLSKIGSHQLTQDTRGSGKEVMVTVVPNAAS